jgi:hypothetical protein
MKLGVSQDYETDKWGITDEDKVPPDYVVADGFDTREEAEVWARKRYGEQVPIIGPEDWPDPDFPFESERPKLRVIEGGKRDEAARDAP